MHTTSNTNNHQTPSGRRSPITFKPLGKLNHPPRNSVSPKMLGHRSGSPPNLSSVQGRIIARVSSGDLFGPGFPAFSLTAESGHNQLINNQADRVIMARKKANNSLKVFASKFVKEDKTQVPDVKSRIIGAVSPGRGSIRSSRPNSCSAKNLNSCAASSKPIRPTPSLVYPQFLPNADRSMQTLVG